jgi:mono/diheme cytochrome c family protein
MKTRSCLVALLACTTLAATSLADEAGVQFFEQKIRPVLVQHCYSCHSVEAREAKKLQGGLYLDSAAGVAAGGESGAVLVKGKSAESLLLKALNYDGSQMPPSGKLPDAVIADFAKWIDLGAPDPRSGDSPVKPKREINVEQGRQWWSYRPLANVTPPNPQKPIDGFILPAQQALGIKPNHPTTREKLIRRAYFDLVGLPPTPEQVAAFVADPSPQAFEKVVDTLLANTAYGERWARHWLDAARFAESGGYEFDGFRPGAYHYRDWVIRALNADMPYDQFVRMQLAGDVLQPDDIDGAAATGFLVAGPYPGQITAKTVERIRYDQLDDMMMTIGGSMLGMTLGCVRCHEHKYDPIPHQDYYAVAAALARTSHGPKTLDTDVAATDRAFEKHQSEHEPLVAALNDFAAKELPARFAAWRGTDLDKQPESTRWQALEPVSFAAERSYLKALPGALIAHDGALTPGTPLRQRGQKRNVGGDEQYRLSFHTQQKNVQALRLDALTDKSLPQRGPGLNGDGAFQLADLKVTARPLDPLAKDAPIAIKLKPVFAAFEDPNQPLSHAVDEKPETAWIVRATAKKDNAAIFEFDPPLPGFTNGTVLDVELKFQALGIGRLRMALSVEPNPATWAGDISPQHTGELRAIVAAFNTNIPEPVRVPLARWFAPFDPETAKLVHAVRDHAASTPRPNLSEVYTTVAGGQDVFFLRRGEVDNKQGKAEPGFLQVLSRSTAPSSPAPATPVDPRITLAQSLTDIERGAGPLLARVIVNRLWQHHFGRGIVGTPNDFGVQGEAPSHPELLEYLASELVRGGWKLKPLHHQMMLSDVYQQSHEADPEQVKLDPTNRTLWHFRPQRLEAETIRDAILAVGGNLDATMYGPSVLDNTPRRSVYLRVKRSELLPIMTMFDAPEPTQSIGERTVTTVPTQALAMMNSPVVRQQAERLAARVRQSVEATKSDPVDLAYRIAFARPATPAEHERMAAFIASGDKTLVEFCHVLLCLNEFVYVD